MCIRDRHIIPAFAIKIRIRGVRAATASNEPVSYTHLDVYKRQVLTLPFIIRTIIIRELGVEYAGLSTLFASILQVLNMTELGFSSAVIFSLYKPMADGDNDAICRCV